MEQAAIGRRQGGENAISKPLEEVAWGLLLVFTGVVWIVPGIPLPFGTWLVGVGAILVGANIVRYWVDTRFDTFGLVLGIVALAAGVEEFLALDVSVIGLALLAFGAVLLLRPLTRMRADRRVAA